MGHTFANLVTHVVFSTKQRQPLIHDAFRERLHEYMAGFARKEFRGSLSVSQSNVPQVATYIEQQPEHHKKLTFEEEFIALLERHGIQYDPRYVWD